MKARQRGCDPRKGHIEFSNCQNKLILKTLEIDSSLNSLIDIHSPLIFIDLRN